MSSENAIPPIMRGPIARPPQCKNCRRPLHYVDDVGWIHGELAKYAGQPITCENAEPLRERT